VAPFVLDLLDGVTPSVPNIELRFERLAAVKAGKLIIDFGLAAEVNHHFFEFLC
jgi:hypothetical protein